MARFNAWSRELEEALAEPFPPALIQQKKIKGSSISFVPWHVYVYRLNDLVGPGWSMGEPILKEVGGKLVMGVSITILGVTRVNFGSEEEEHGNAGEDGVVRDFGSAETNAFAQSFKRTCALFGLGLSMYDKHGAVAKWTEQAAHDVALAFIRDVGARCADDVLLTMDGREPEPLKEAVRKAWPTVKREAAAARAFAKAIEESTGQQFNP